MSYHRFAGAVCADLPTWEVDRLFFGTPGRINYSAAVAYCQGCPVRFLCLEDALAYELDGPLDLCNVTDVRGGKTPAERIAMLRARRKAAPIPD